MSSPIRVALNLVYLTPGETGGMEVYARELLPRLAALPGVEPVAIVNEVAATHADAPWRTAMEHVVAPVDARDRKQWVWGEQRHVPRLATAAGADLVHSLASTGPGRLAGGPPRVTTVHDLHYAVAPEAHFGLRGLGMRILVPAAIHASRRVIAISQATKDDVARIVGTAPERIDVVSQAATPPGEAGAVPQAASPPGSAGAASLEASPSGGAGGDPGAAPSAGGITPTPEADLRRALGLGDRPVLLSVSAKRPHKNVEGLIDALAAILPERRPLLVVPGYPTEHDPVLRRRAVARNVADDLRLPGWLPTADVEGLWRIAAAHIFPSFYEGFGLPVLEALQRGVPSACSDRASMPEVAGDAALLFDPSDVSQITATIERLLGDEALRADLVVRGTAQAARFSWERCAEQTAQVYARALEA